MPLSSAGGQVPDAEGLQDLSKSDPRRIARAACCISPEALGYEEDAGEPQPLRVIILPTRKQICQYGDDSVHVNRRRPFTSAV